MVCNDDIKQKILSVLNKNIFVVLYDTYNIKKILHE